MNALLLRGLLPALLLLPLAAAAQETDDYQPDSVMRANHVRTKTRRHTNSLSLAREVWEYDRTGRLSSYYLTDNNKGNKRQFTIRYAYDPTGRLLRETYQGSGEPNRVTDYTYAPNGDYRAVEYSGGRKNVIGEQEFRADSARLTERHISDGQVYRTDISYYERPLFTRRFMGSEPEQPDAPQQSTVVINGQAFTFQHESAERWCYDFRNRYDAYGRLLERVRLENGQERERHVYTYDAAGLLIEKAQFTPGRPTAAQSEKYTYTTW